MVQKIDFPRRGNRQFCPPDFNPSQWEEIKPLFRELKERVISSSQKLEEWIFDCNELLCILSEEEAIRFIRTMCHTENEEFEAKYMDFVENIKPKLKPEWNWLHRRYLEEAEKFSLPEDRYHLFHRSLDTQVSLFSEDNIPLQVEVAKLGQKYNKIRGAMTVEWEGEEKTLPQLRPFLQKEDREVREKAWRLMCQRRLKDKEKFSEIFDQLFSLRVQIAKNAGHPDYRSYRFKKLERFDYTPQDCLTFHDAIEKVVIPLSRELDKRRKEKLGVEVLRPWDMAVDPENRPPLKPFDTTEELVEGCKTIFKGLDEDFYKQFVEMNQLGLLDLENRKGKAPGGFQHALEESQYPFIFMNSVGLHRDLETLLHEAGHAFNYFACASDPLVSYRHPPMEFAEVASMSMELLAMGEWDIFYEKPEFIRAQKEALEGALAFFPWCAVIDRFQHELYTRPDHDREQRREIWLEILDRFSGLADWTGLEEYRAFMWQRQLHLYEVPFYYIEYGFAQMGALQVWLNARRDPQKALAQYKEALALGGSQPLRDLYKAAGIDLIFQAEDIAPIMAQVWEEIERLEEVE